MIAAWDGDPRSRSGSGEVVASGDESPLPASLFSGSTRWSVAAASLRDGMGSVHYRMQAAKKKRLMRRRRRFTGRRRWRQGRRAVPWRRGEVGAGAARRGVGEGRGAARAEVEARGTDAR